MTLPRTVTIREVGPREGFQTLPLTVPTEKKLALIAQLGRTGVSHIEVTSFVRADRLPQMADAGEVVARFEQVAGVEYSALYLNPKGFELAEATKRLSNRGWLQIAASETFLRNNSNRAIDEAVAEFPSWCASFRRAGKNVHGLMLSTAFGCNYEGEISESRVKLVLEKVCAVLEPCGESLHEVCLADTVGRGNPNSIRRRVDLVRELLPHTVVSLHLHDTRGTGMANVYAGLEAGVAIFDASVGGMGGCPFTPGAAGNVPSEDVAYLCASLGIKTGINLDEYCHAAKLAEQIVGGALPGKYYKIGGTGNCTL